MAARPRSPQKRVESPRPGPARTSAGPSPPAAGPAKAGQGWRIIALFALLSLAVGGAVAVSGTFTYRGAALFSVDVPPDDPSALKPYRIELINHAWASVPTAEAQPGFRWDVEADAEAGTLRLMLTANDPDAGQQALGLVAEGYLAHIRTIADQNLNQASDGELILQERLNHLRSGLSEVTRRERSHREALPDTEVGLRRDRVRQSMEQQRRAFLEERDRLRTAKARLVDLRAQPVPERPPVDSETAAQAMHADVQVRQDVAELEVQRAAARAQLLNVWQNAAPPMEELVAAAGRLQRSLSDDTGGRASGLHRAVMERSIEAADEYRALLRSFSQAWTREFTSLRRYQDTDIGFTRILDAQKRIATLLADFLYQASSSLTVIRDQVRALNAVSEDQARHHVLTARLARSFHALQTAHHQFEFAGSEVQTANNFRLAAAIKAIRGLRRRIQARQAQITRQLEQSVRQQLEQARQAEIAELRDRIARLSASTNASLDSLLVHQDEFNRAASQAERLAAGQATAAILAERIDQMNDETVSTEKRIDGLAGQRYSPVRPELVRLISCHVGSTPSNLLRRIAYGWGALATTMLALLAIQGLVRARRGS